MYKRQAGYLADARNGASGTWNDTLKPSIPLTPGWMDDPFRTDPNFHDRERLAWMRLWQAHFGGPREIEDLVAAMRPDA